MTATPDAVQALADPHLDDWSRSGPTVPRLRDGRVADRRLGPDVS